MKTIKDVNLENKKVLIRCDFNVPMKEGKIVDDTRITAALPTIQYALDNNAKVILFSHLGRVKEEADLTKNNLAPVAKRLEELLTKLDDLEEIPKTIKESISKEMKYIEQLGKSINQYKKESVVLINQITTISKQRIFYDVVLKNVRLSNESLNLIDEQIIKFLQNKKESCY